ncbi:uncharacterized protein LOC111086670 [Limulus polyphemus]|uniref:Uncharacterized protein LOC111086670 n=1 Tax=Limulus polyphemus TaxID=6850 RepID=A0ABM1SRA5_LIMPO|nr:uncharacterized protein LOC111086670 [Limulus polyphemus]
MMMTTRRFLSLFVATLLLLPMSTVCNTLFQTNFERRAGEEFRNQESLLAELLNYNIDRFLQNDSYIDDQIDESDRFLKPKVSPLELLIRDLAKAKEKYEQAGFLKDNENEANVGYQSEELVKSEQISKHSQQKQNTSFMKDENHEERDKKSRQATSGKVNFFISDETPQEQKENSRIAVKDYVKLKRGDRPSLSIVSPLDVLRQRLILEMAQRKMKQSQHQIIANAELLENLGKRNLYLSKTGQALTLRNRSVH